MVGQLVDVHCSGGGCFKLRRGGAESAKVVEDVPHSQVALAGHDRLARAEAGGNRDEVAVRDLRIWSSGMQTNKALMRAAP